MIVEGTAGNTGIGLAVVGNALGYRTVIVMPRTQSQEKKDAVRSLGAKLVEVDAVPYANPNHYVKYSARLAEEMAKTEPNGADLGEPVRQRRQPPARTTRPPDPKIWEQTDGKVDGFICSVGSGGTLGGVSMALKERIKKVRIGIADPGGASLYSYYKTGELKAEGTSITEGIGQSRITANLEGVEVDDAWRIEDADAVKILFDLTQRRRHVPRRLVRHQHRRRDGNGEDAGQGIDGRHGAVPTTATAICRSSTTAPSSGRKACRRRTGMTAEVRSSRTGASPGS